MKYRKFSIKGYRAIENTDVLFNQNQLIPLIGINESGKTSILHAILAFDKSKDRSNGSKHLTFKNKYIIKEEECVITAHVFLESEEEKMNLMDAMAIKEGSMQSIEVILDLMRDEKKCFEIERDLKTKEYSLSNTSLPEEYHKKCIKHLLQGVPLILYFDDFSDRVPEKIEFNKEYKKEGTIKGASQASEWKRLLEEIFKRSERGHSLQDFLKIKDDDDRDGLLSDVGDVLNREIMDEWKAFKNIVGSEDNELKLELKLKYTLWNDGSHTFNFKVVDKTSGGGSSRQFDVVHRSKGFQWFFNFILKLKFNDKYKTNPTGAIYLLDEPGSYLHASAQEELLKKLQDISKTNVIFYCTHSQHLLNPDLVNISSIKIAAKGDGVVDLKPFSSTGVVNSQGALTPLFDALKSNLQIIENSHKRIIVTEGVTDYYFLKMLSEYTDRCSLDNIHVIPGAGAGQLKDLISLTISKTDMFYVIFDRDHAGKREAKRYKEYFNEWILEHFIFYGDDQHSGDFVLEDYIVDEDRARLYSITNGSDVKSSLIQLYFSEKRVKEIFFSSLGEDFFVKFAPVLSKLHKLKESKSKVDFLK